MPPARLFRTSSFRLTLLYAGLFSGSVLILFAAIYFAIVGYMTQQLDRAIDAEVSVLAEEARVAGIERLAAIIGERAVEIARTGTVYLLQTADDRLLAGNLRPRRPVIGWLSFRGRSRAAEGEEPHRIRALSVRLDDGSYLLVGQDANKLEQVEELVIRAFAWSAAVTILLALAGGMLMSASVLRRIGSIARASRAVMDGDLAQRIPSRGVDDEFDQLADALNAMIARIETLMDGLMQVSNDIAHDLRTPLSRLRHRLEAVQRARPTIADYEALVDNSIRDADAILETFAAMLRVAEVEATTRKAGFAEVDLSEILKTVLEVYEPLAAEHSDALTGRIASPLAMRGDRELLTQLFANLVQNAIIHTPRGTHITVEAAEASGMIEAIVGDTGFGVPEDERDKVFRRFYRLEASRSMPGSGLGLSLVKAIATLHGADITLSDNQPGLRIRLRFPTD